MNILFKVLLFPALCLSIYAYFMVFIGGGGTGRQLDFLKGLVLGSLGFFACMHCASAVYFGPGLAGSDWIVLLVALGPAVIMLVKKVRSSRARRTNDDG